MLLIGCALLFGTRHQGRPAVVAHLLFYECKPGVAESRSHTLGLPGEDTGKNEEPIGGEGFRQKTFIKV